MIYLVKMMVINDRTKHSYDSMTRPPFYIMKMIIKGLWHGYTL